MTQETDKNPKQPTPDGADGDLQALVESLSDLKHRLAQAQSALETSRAQNAAFLSNLSREIRTPLNGIMGCLGFLRDSRLDADQQEQMRIIRDCAEHLLSTVGDMVDFISVQEGNRAIESMAFDVVMAVEEVLQGAAARAHERGLELIADVSPDSPAREYPPVAQATSCESG